MKALFGDTIEQVGNGRLILRSGESFGRAGTLCLESGVAPLADVPPERVGEKILELIDKSGLPL